MEQRDYLMREFDRFARAFGKLLGELLDLKAERNYSAMYSKTGKAFEETLRQSLPALLQVPEENFIAALLQQNISLEGIEKLFEVFYELVMVPEAPPQVIDKVMLIRRSLLLKEYLDKKSENFSFDRHLKALDLENKIKD